LWSITDTLTEPRFLRVERPTVNNPATTQEDCTMRMGLVSVFVDDQDRAERFYAQVLGFKVKTSAPYGPDERWLSVVSREEPDGVELVLHLTDHLPRSRGNHLWVLPSNETTTASQYLT
jgi:hypothetical protein